MGPNNLLDRFKDALADENLAEFRECVARFLCAPDGPDGPPAAALAAVLLQLEVLLDFHGDLLRRWAAELAEFREAMAMTAFHLERLLGEAADDAGE